MDFFAEIKAFDREMLRHPLPTAAQLLWYKLMTVANGLFWPEWFTVDNDRLARLLNSSENTTKAARSELIKVGFLQFERGVKGQPSRYKLLSIAAMEQPHQEAPEDAGAPPAEQPPDVDVPLYWDAEDITSYFGFTDDTAREVKIITEKLYGAYMPSVRPTKQDERRVFLWTYKQVKSEAGEWSITFPAGRKELLAYAFEKADAAGALNWKYMDGILRRLAQRGIKNSCEAYAYDEDREAHGGKGVYEE